MPFRIGCQLITWRSHYDQENNKAQFGLPVTDISRMLQEVKDAGYDGVGGMIIRSMEELPEYLLTCRTLNLDIAQLSGPLALSAALDMKSYMTGGATRKQYHEGHPTEEDFQRAIEEVRATVRKGQEYGLQVYLHNHLWTMAEKRAEIDRFLEAIPELYLCPDIAHLAAAGDDPLSLIQDYGPRLANIHLKDWLQFKGKRGPFAYPDGIFVELGQGNIGIDIPAVMRLLEEVHYSGWVIVELDITRTTPFESARMSRTYLKDLGY